MTRFYRWLIVGSAFGYLLALGVAYTIGSTFAVSKAERLLDVSVEQMRREMSDSATEIIRFVGLVLKRAYADPSAATREELLHFGRLLEVDEICLCDSNGVITCATDEKALPGSSFGLNSPARTVDYTPLVSGGAESVVEEIRGSVERPDLRRKYGAVALENRMGFVQVGFDESRLLRGFRVFYESMCVNWKVGEMSHYLLVDPCTSRIMSAYAKKDVGRRLRSVMPELPEESANVNRTLHVTENGLLCHVRDFMCAGYRVVAVVPDEEVAGIRNVMLAVVASILLFLIVVFDALLAQIVRRNRQMRKYFESRKAQADKDLAMAKAIQSNALPTVFPPFPSLVDRVDLHAMMIPAKEVGGDFYDFYFTGTGRLAIVIADVSGKGVPAAMFMMRVKSTLQGLLRGGGDIAEVMSTVNQRISDGNEANMFVTAWVGVVELETGHVEYVNAGHNPPLLKHTDGRVEWLRERSGPALAAIGDFSYRKHQLDLMPGDGIFLYTDGVTEAADAALELFGEKRLEKFLTGRSGPDGSAGRILSSREFCDDLLTGIRQFVAGAEQVDDITVLAFKLNGVEKSFGATEDGMIAAQAYLEHFYEDPKPSIIMDEIVSNIVRCSGAHTFVIKFACDGQNVRMTFVDDGKAFDPTKDIADPDITAPIEARDVGGLGIYMVKKMSKSVTYAREDGKNVLTVVVGGG